MYIKLFQEILYYTDDYKQVLDKNYLWMDTDIVELQSPLPCNANNYIIAALGRVPHILITGWKLWSEDLHLSIINLL